MESEPFYCDVESTKSVSSQLRGRRSVLLSSLPDSFLTARDANLSVWSQKSWSSHRAPNRPAAQPLRGAPRTAPTSPVRSRPRAAPPRRPLTPTLTRNTTAVEANATAAVKGSAHCESRGRWVCFSCASGAASRELSEVRSVSRTPPSSPPPRAAIMPSAFPNLCFSDVAEESEKRFGESKDARDACVSVDEGAAGMGSPTPPPPRWSVVAPRGDSPPLQFEKDSLRKGRESMLLVLPPEPPRGIPRRDHKEGYIRMSTESQNKKRLRSPEPSPVCVLGSSPSIVIGGDSVVLVAAEETHADEKEKSETKDEDTQSAMEPKRRRTGALETFPLENEEKAEVEKDEMEKMSPVTHKENNSVLADASPSLLLVPQIQKESLLLINGSTPTPWRQLQSAAVVEKEMDRMRHSEVIDADPIALFTDNSPIPKEPGTMEPASVVLTASEDCPVKPLELCPRADFVALIQTAKEELRRASGRLIAATGGTRNSARISFSPPNASVRLSVGAPVHGEPHVQPTSNPNTDYAERAKRQCTPPFGETLHTALVAHADRILRRLRGYDVSDVGFLPGGLVARVVCQVLGADSAPSPSAAPECKRTWESSMARQEAQAAEESSMQLYVSLWRCFRERFGERCAADRFGVTAHDTSGPYRWTAFPRLRQQLAQRTQQTDEPPLDTLIDYKVFANSLADLK